MIVCEGPKVFCSTKTDSHSEMRKEFGLPDNDRRIFNVQIEITPPNNDFLADFGLWNFRTDQDHLPSWWEAQREDAEAECRRQLEIWARTNLVRPGDVRDTLNPGDYVSVVCGGTVNEVWGGTVNEVWGGTVNEVCGGTVNKVWGGTVNAVRGGAVNKVCGGTVNKVWGGTVNEVWGGAVNKVCGGTVNKVWGGTVNAVCGGTVNEVRGGTVTVAWTGFSGVVSLTGVSAAVLDRTGKKFRLHQGREKTRKLQFGPAKTPAKQKG